MENGLDKKLVGGLVESAATPQPLDDEEIKTLARWRSEFIRDFRNHKKWIDKKKIWGRFYDGEQLTGEEKEALRKRNQPEVVINLVKPRVDGAVGDFLGRRVMMRAYDMGSQDFDKARHITEAMRYVERQNKFDEKEELGARDLMIDGQAFYKVGLEFDFNEPEIKITHRPNDDIVVDRNCRERDMGDAKRLYETIWVEAEELARLFPEAIDYIRAAMNRTNENLAGSADGSITSYLGDDYAKSDNSFSADTNSDFETFVDPKRHRIRIINIWERVSKRVEFGYHPDIKPSGLVNLSDLAGDERAAVKRLYPEMQVFVKLHWQLNAGIFIDNKILEYKKDVRPHDSKGKFPFARAVATFERNESAHPYGLVKQFISPQEEYNKRRSKLLHKTNVSRIIAEEGAVEDIERVRREAARPDGVILHKPGMAFQIDKDEAAQADIYLLELSNSEIEKAGVSREFIGTETKQLSGRAIGLRQAEGNKMLRQYYSALRAARRDVFGIVLEEMQQYWRSEKLVKITDDLGAQDLVLNQRVVDPATGQVVILNELALGKYDIKVDEDMETPNQRSETFQQLVQLAQVALQAGEPVPFEMIIKSSDLSNKAEWMQAIQARRQQQQQMLQMQALASVGAAQQNGQVASPV